MENFLELLISAIGKNIDSDEVIDLFNDQDIDERISIDEDDYETYVTRPLLGYSFNIISQPYVKNPAFKKGSRNSLVLRGCHFYSREAEEGYRQYVGELPNKLNFIDSQNEVLQKLGKAVWQYDNDGKILRERWEFAGADRQLNITYSEDESSIEIIYYGIREFFTF